MSLLFPFDMEMIFLDKVEFLRLMDSQESFCTLTLCPIFLRRYLCSKRHEDKDDECLLRSWVVRTKIRLFSFALWRKKAASLLYFSSSSYDLFGFSFFSRLFFSLLLLLFLLLTRKWDETNANISLADIILCFQIIMSYLHERVNITI